MNKKTLIRVVENIDYFNESNSPQEIYLNLRSYPGELLNILNVMTGKDVMLFCFLAYEQRFSVDLSKLYDFISNNYTLNLKCITSPSFTIYSFPSTLNLPASLHLASEP